MSQVERRFLQKLRDSEDHCVLLTSVARGCQGILEDMEACGAVDRRFIKRASRVKICCQATFKKFVESRFPLGIDAKLNEVFDRAGAVIAFGDAKAISRGSEEGIFVRTAKPEIVIFSTDGAEIPVGALSEDAGGAALKLTNDREWTFSGTIAVIENAEPFWQHEKVLPNIDLAVYASGNMSQRLVEWLTSESMSSCQIIHWGDYDPRGVAEYLRLHDRCPGRVESFVPDSIDQLMKHGKRKLWEVQSRSLEKLRGRTGNRHVSRMLTLFDHHRKGLEQEVLLGPKR